MRFAFAIGNALITLITTTVATALSAVPVRRWFAHVLALAVAVGLLAVGAPVSGAKPEDVGAVPGPLTLPLTDLGTTEPLAFYGQGSQQLTVPVPTGLTPAALNAIVELPLAPRAGMLTVTQDERTITRVPLPATDQAPIVIPLAGARVVDHWATVVLRTYLLPADGYCVDPTNPLRLTNPTITYAGTEQPAATVADFLPPLLRKLTIFLPQSPSKAESDAALRLATTITAQFGKQAPAIAVVPLSDGQAAPPTPAAPMERYVVLKEGPDTGLSLNGTPGMPWLLISGPPDALKSQVRLLFTTLSGLALSPKAAVGPLKLQTPSARDSASLRDLGQPGANTAGGLSPQVTIALDQTRFGGPVHNVGVHLQGSYTPVPPEKNGQIVASIGGETIAHWAADGDGVIDRQVDVPDRLLKRNTNLDVLLSVSENTGRCGDFNTVGPGDSVLKLTVDGDSVVTVSPASPPVPDGLQAMPQALTSDVQVGIGTNALEDTKRAVAILVGLQRMSALPIATTLTSVQDAIDSAKPAILIAADGWKHPNVALPVSVASEGPITVDTVDAASGTSVTLMLDPQRPIGSLEAAVDRGRSLLVATSNGSAAQLDELLGWLNGDKELWPSLKGDAVVSTPGREPQTVDIATTAPETPEEDHTQRSLLWSDSDWRLWLGGGIAAVVVVGLAAILMRGRRKPEGG